MNITVYLGAHEGNDPIYKKAVEELGIWIADNGNRLVYGGSDEGLMAVIADTVLAHDGDVTGIEAQMFVDRGVAHHNLTQLVVVPNIVERRTRMIELGDVFIAFPGGTGTLEEISEVVSKICLDQLTQPCIFYNLNGFLVYGIVSLMRTEIHGDIHNHPSLPTNMLAPQTKVKTTL